MANPIDSDSGAGSELETVFLRWKDFDAYLTSGYVIPLNFDAPPPPRDVATNTPGVEAEPPGAPEGTAPSLFDAPSLTANPVAALVPRVTVPSTDVWQAIWYANTTTPTFVLAARAGMIFEGY